MEHETEGKAEETEEEEEEEEEEEKEEEEGNKKWKNMAPHDTSVTPPFQKREINARNEELLVSYRIEAIVVGPTRGYKRRNRLGAEGTGGVECGGRGEGGGNGAKTVARLFYNTSFLVG